MFKIEVEEESKKDVFEHAEQSEVCNVRIPAEIEPL